MKTGYFARASQNGVRGKWTNVHIVDEHENPICGYVPHESMKFQFNAQSVYMQYVECKRCKESLSTHYEVVETEYGRSFRAEFYRNRCSNTNVEDIVQNASKSFPTVEEVKKHATITKRLYTRFMNKVRK